MNNFTLETHGTYVKKKGDKLWSFYSREVTGHVEEYLINSIDYSKPAVLVACLGQSMCTRLLIESLIYTREFETIGYLVVVDSSPKDYTSEILRKYFKKHPGYLVRMNVKTFHSEALDIATMLGLFKKVQYIQFLDNDIEILKRGLARKIIKDMNAIKDRVDIGGRLLGLRECTYHKIQFLAPPVFTTGFVMRRDYWEHKEQQDSCAIRVDIDKKLYYDTWSYMLGTNPKAKSVVVDYTFEYIKHYGQITANRHKYFKTPEHIEYRHFQIFQSLCRFGVPVTEIHDDKAEAIPKFTGPAKTRV